MNNFHRALVLIATFATVACSGCAQIDMKKGIPWGVDEIGSKDEQPMKIVPFWVETVLHRDDSSPTRGFGGRLFFYGQKQGKPIKVEGSLVVYGFLENGRDPANNKPDKKFVFTAEQFARHYKKGDAGHSYDFWIPWDEANGPQQEISLICRFTPKNGSLIVSEQTRHQLSGNLNQSPTPHQSPIPITGAGASTAAGGAVVAAVPLPPGTAPLSSVPPSQLPQGTVQQASFMQTLPQTAPVASNGLQTTTIDLPPRFGHQAGTDPLRTIAGAPPNLLPQTPSAMPISGVPQMAQNPAAPLTASAVARSQFNAVTPGLPGNSSAFPTQRLQPIGGQISRLQRNGNQFQATQVDLTNQFPAATGINSPSATR
jgi:hypothetical protein